MIPYYKGAFNLNLLLRVSGSSVYRGMLPGFVALFLYIGIAYMNADVPDKIEHPQAVVILISSVSLIIVFKVNQAYSRHWEAYGRVFEMMSRFQDATQHIVAYHMQCDHYNTIKPPSYFDYPEANDLFLTRDREIRSLRQNNVPPNVAAARVVRKSINLVQNEFKDMLSARWDKYEKQSMREFFENCNEPQRLQGKPRLDGGWERVSSRRKTATFFNILKSEKIGNAGFASYQGGRTPSLYLQELVHLTSLLNAVALSTLRNDTEESSCPLDIYAFGEKWPEEDPTEVKSLKLPLWERLKQIFGADISRDTETSYNASRPLGVIGGVSEAEIAMLRMARGPYAKTQLAFNWLSEFYVREHLSGSTGTCGSPLISRSMQFLSNGMVNYNHARKIMYIPFPFPHAQLTAFFVLIILPIIPVMLDEYTTTKWLGGILSFLAVSCLCGLHEVSRELENPFQKIPNEVPLCTLQAQFNEALITAYSGYHPDAYFAEFLDQLSSMKKNTTSSSDSLESLSSSSQSNESIISLNDEPSSKLKRNCFSQIGSTLLEDTSNDSEISKIQNEIERHCSETKRLRCLLKEKKDKRKALSEDSVKCN